MWPFGRRRSANDGGATGVVHRAARADWRAVGPIRPVLSNSISTVDTAFERDLTTRAAPGFLEPLGHHVEPDAPAGVAEDLATLVPPTSRAFPPDPRSSTLATGSAAAPVQTAAEPRPSAGTADPAPSELAPTGLRSPAPGPPTRPTIIDPTMSRAQPAQEPAATVPAATNVVVPREGARSLLDAPPPPVSLLHVPAVARAAETPTADVDAGRELVSTDREETVSEVAEPTPAAEPWERPLIAQRDELPEISDAPAAGSGPPDRRSAEGAATPARTSRQATGPGPERPGPDVRIGAPFTTRPPVQRSGQSTSDTGNAMRDIGGRSTVDPLVSGPPTGAQPNVVTSGAERGSSSSTVGEARPTSADDTDQASQPALPDASAPAPAAGDGPTLPLVGSPEDAPTVLRSPSADVSAPRTPAQHPPRGAVPPHLVQRRESTDTPRGSVPESGPGLASSAPQPRFPTSTATGRTAPPVSGSPAPGHSPRAPGATTAAARSGDSLLARPTAGPDAPLVSRTPALGHPHEAPAIGSVNSRAVEPSRGLDESTFDHDPAPPRAGSAPAVARRLIADRPPIGNTSIMTRREPSDSATPGSPEPGDVSSLADASHRQSPPVQRAAVDHRRSPTPGALATSRSPSEVTIFASAADARARLGSNGDVAPFSSESGFATHPDRSDTAVLQRQVDAVADATTPPAGSERAGAGATPTLPIAPTGRTAGEPPSDEEVAELVRALYPSLHRRLSRDFLLDRERAGYRTDIRF